MSHIRFFPFFYKDLEALRQTAADSLLQAAKVRSVRYNPKTWSNQTRDI